MEIVTKAWRVGNELEEPYLYPTDEAYLGTRGQARDKAWSDFEGAKCYLGLEISFLNLSMIRYKEHDIILFNGKRMRRYLADTIIENNKRMERVKASRSKFFYVQDSRTYIGNAMVFWALDSSGYTSDPMRAHRYTKEEILSSTWRETDKIIPEDLVRGAIKQHCDSQYIAQKDRI